MCSADVHCEVELGRVTDHSSDVQCVVLAPIHRLAMLHTIRGSLSRERWPQLGENKLSHCGMIMMFSAQDIHHPTAREVLTCSIDDVCWYTRLALTLSRSRSFLNCHSSTSSVNSSTERSLTFTLSEDNQSLNYLPPLYFVTIFVSVLNDLRLVRNQPDHEMHSELARPY